jgi:hypothetical protein
MILDQLSGIIIGTVLLVVVFAGLFIAKRTLRDKLFPGPARKDRDATMTELLLFQAQLEERAGEGSRPGGNNHESPDRGAGRPGGFPGDPQVGSSDPEVASGDPGVASSDPEVGP